MVLETRFGQSKIEEPWSSLHHPPSGVAPQDWRGEQEGVDSVEHPSMTGQDAT